MKTGLAVNADQKILETNVTEVELVSTNYENGVHNVMMVRSDKRSYKLEEKLTTE